MTAEFAEQLHASTYELDQAHTASEAQEWIRTLRHLHNARQALTAAEQAAVTQARSHAVTWQEVADVYGVTKQAAQQRFRTSAPPGQPVLDRRPSSYVAENKPVTPDPDPAPTLTRQQRRALEREQQRRRGS